MKEFSYSVWLLSFLGFIGLPAGLDIPCYARQESQSYICVCNSTHCDTLERPAPLARGQYYWYKTSNSTPGFSHTIGSFSGSDVEEDVDTGLDDVVFKINASITFQELLGVGASFTDTSGLLFKSLPEAAQDKLIESYFGTNGIEYNLGRLPIGGTDFSPRVYTLDDTPFDENLKYFNLTEEDYNYKIPYIKKALAVSQRGIKLMACTWMAPGWMKDNDNFHRGYVREKYLHAFAQYYIKFLEAYKENGIDIWALSGGNEVLLTMFLPIAQNSLNSTLVFAPTQRQWLKEHLKPLLMASNFSHVKFVALDDTRLFAPYWMEHLAADPVAYNSVDGIALHWYFDWFTPTSLLDSLHEKHPDKPILYTESSINSGGPALDLGYWFGAEAYMYNIIENFSHWMQSYMDWNLAVDPSGGPSLGLDVAGAVVVNSDAGEFYKQPIFYALGHFSKFMPPGAKRILVESNQNNTPRAYLPFPGKFSIDTLKGLKSSIGFEASEVNPTPPPDPHMSIPPVIWSVATANPDGSTTVLVFSTQNETTTVKLQDPRLGFATVDIEAHSINSFIYWL